MCNETLSGSWDVSGAWGPPWKSTTCCHLFHSSFHHHPPLDCSFHTCRFSFHSARTGRIFFPQKIVTKMLKRIFEIFFKKRFKLTRLFWKKTINSRPFEFELVDRWVEGQLLIEWTKLRGKTFSDLNARLISSFKKRTRFVTFSSRSPSWTISLKKNKFGFKHFEIEIS